MPETSHHLLQVLNKIQALKAFNKNTLVVFDLDSTLFDVGPRMEMILNEFAQRPEFQKKFPEEIQHFHKIKSEPSDWGIPNILNRAGIPIHNPHFKTQVHEFWSYHFFSNHYLKYDQPYEGAIDFVLDVAATGSEIVYLTGRDVHRMEEGSREALKQWGFPLDDKKSKLKLKPHKDLDDAEFKTQWFIENHTAYDHVLFFENEPTNIHPLLELKIPIEIIFFSSTHSGRHEPPKDIAHIKHYKINK